MDRTNLLLAIGALLYLGAIWLADPFIVRVLGLTALFLLGAPAVAISAIILIFAIGTGRSPRSPLAVLSSVLSLAVLIGAAIPLNRFVHERSVAAAKAYPGRVAPLLEAYRKEHGSYPASLSQIPTAPSMPRLLWRIGYRSNGQTYSFTFSQPGGLIDTWEYDSRTGEWHLST